MFYPRVCRRLVKNGTSASFHSIPPPPAAATAGQDNAAVEEVKQEVPPAQSQVSPREESMQLSALGIISLYLALSIRVEGERAGAGSPLSIGGRNAFPKTQEGPLAFIDPYEWEGESTAVTRSSFKPSSVGGDAQSQTVEGVQQQEQGEATSGAAGDEETKGSEPATPRASLQEEQYARYLLASLVFFTHASSPLTCTSVVSSIWRWIVDRWEAPTHFLRLFANVLLGGKITRDLKAGGEIVGEVIDGGLCECIKALVSLLQRVTGSGTDDLSNTRKDENAMDVTIMADTHTASSPTLLSATSTSSLHAIGNSPVVPLTVPPLTQKTAKEIMYSACDFFTYSIKLLWLAGQWEECVATGSSLCELYITQAPELCKRVGEAVIPLILHAQEQLLDNFSELLRRRNDEKTVFVNDFEEYLKKKRRKKLRVKRLEKDEDELRFDAEVAVYDARISAATASFRQAEGHRDTLLLLQKRFDTQFSSARQLLAKVRKARRNFFQKCDKKWCAVLPVVTLSSQTVFFPPLTSADTSTPDYRFLLAMDQELLVEYDDLVSLVCITIISYTLRLHIHIHAYIYIYIHIIYIIYNYTSV